MEGPSASRRVGVEPPICEKQQVRTPRLIFPPPLLAALLLAAAVAPTGCAAPEPAGGGPGDLDAALDDALAGGGDPSLGGKPGRTAADRARAEALVAEGTRLRDAGDLPGSRQVLDQALQLDASYARAHVEWALTAEGLAVEPALVASHYQLGARLAPQDPRAQLLAAAWAARQGDAARALEGYDRALVADPRSIEAWARRGDLLLARGDALAAVASYERARAVDPAFVPALMGLADAGEKAARPDVAEAAHQELVELFPRVAIYRTRLIAFYRRTGQDDKATAAQRALDKVQPGDTRKLRKLRKLESRR